MSFSANRCLHEVMDRAAGTGTIMQIGVIKVGRQPVSF